MPLLAADEGSRADPVGPDPTPARFAFIPPGSSAKQTGSDDDGTSDSQDSAAAGRQP